MSRRRLHVLAARAPNRGTLMKHLPITLAGALLFAGAATLAFAQTAPTAQPQTNPNTKVYAYKKTAPAKQTAAPAATNSPSEHLVGSVPWGSLQWWELMGRMDQPSD
jgi:hypothetical protein